jgi:hypothetical protein
MKIGNERTPRSKLAWEKRCSFVGSMSSVGVRFFESRSILVFISILMFIRKIPVLWHGKQTFQCQSLN